MEIWWILSMQFSFYFCRNFSINERKYRWHKKWKMITKISREKIKINICCQNFQKFILNKWSKSMNFYWKCKFLPVHILVWILNILKVHPEQFFVFAIASLVTEFVDDHNCLVFCYLNEILNYHISHTQFWRTLSPFFHFKLIIYQSAIKKSQ